jgi:hypothetical protein
MPTKESGPVAGVPHFGFAVSASFSNCGRRGRVFAETERRACRLVDHLVTAVIDLESKATFMVMALSGSLILPMRVSAQGAAPPAGSAGAGAAAVSGVPIGPGSAGGTNNSVYDPSGIGNAPKPLQPRSPASNSMGLAGPAASSAISSPPPGPRLIAPRQRVTAARGTRRAARAYNPAAARAAISAQDKLLDRKLISICRGC